MQWSQRGRLPGSPAMLPSGVGSSGAAPLRSPPPPPYCLLRPRAGTCLEAIPCRMPGHQGGKAVLLLTGRLELLAGETRRNIPRQWEVWRGRDRAGSRERAGRGACRAWVWRAQGVRSPGLPCGRHERVCVCSLGWGCGGGCPQAEGFPATGRSPEPGTPHPPGSVTPRPESNRAPPSPRGGTPPGEAE